MICVKLFCFPRWFRSIVVILMHCSQTTETFLASFAVFEIQDSICTYLSFLLLFFNTIKCCASVLSSDLKLKFLFSQTVYRETSFVPSIIDTKERWMWRWSLKLSCDKTILNQRLLLWFLRSFQLYHQDKSSVDFWLKVLEEGGTWTLSWDHFDT